jgi:ATP adenylyltransferase
VAEKPSGCIFCEAAAAGDGDGSLVVYRGERVFVILNRYPYTNGHLMVAPYRHEAWLSSSDAETLTELIGTIARAERILVSAYHTDGLNVGINFGSAAGAGVAGHYHVHVVPAGTGHEFHDGHRWHAGRSGGAFRDARAIEAALFGEEP